MRVLLASDLMLEHLHPNLEGYFVLTDAFYDAVYESRIGWPAVELCTQGGCSVGSTFSPQV